MKQRFINDLRTTANNVLWICDKLQDIANCRENFHGGEVATLSLTIGKTTLSDLSFSADKRAVFADEIFTDLENYYKNKMNEAICDFQTILETESAE